MLLAELGFEVNAYGRGDAPVEEPWETALHHSAADGNAGGNITITGSATSTFNRAIGWHRESDHLRCHWTISALTMPNMP